jgi:alpha-galactosidase
MSMRCVLARSILLGLAAAVALAAVPQARAEKTVRVFILAGQSNMEGKGHHKHLRKLVEQKPATYGHLRENGEWTKRPDVFVKFNDRTSRLRAGLGKPDNRIGPELGFGHVMGDAIDDPVLIIKTAWGGHSLAMHFRPPSAGDPEYEWSDGIKKQINAGQTPVGQSYRNMMRKVKSTLNNLGGHFPALKGHQPKIAGFVWFQGFNDAINGNYRAEYEKNLTLLIRDVRDDLKAPNLPFVIGEFGQSGPEPYNAKHTQMREAQKAVAEKFAMNGNVALARTTTCFHKKPKYDGGYHYRGNAETFYEIGQLFGQKMISLIKH